MMPVNREVTLPITPCPPQGFLARCGPPPPAPGGQGPDRIPRGAAGDTAGPGGQPNPPPATTRNAESPRWRSGNTWAETGRSGLSTATASSGRSGSIPAQVVRPPSASILPTPRGSVYQQDARRAQLPAQVFLDLGERPLRRPPPRHDDQIDAGRQPVQAVPHDLREPAPDPIPHDGAADPP